MTDKEIRKQIEDELCNYCPKEIKGCNEIDDCNICNIEYLIKELVKARKELIKERKLSAAKQETIDRLVLGEKGE